MKELFLLAGAVTSMVLWLFVLYDYGSRSPLKAGCEMACEEHTNTDLLTISNNICLCKNGRSFKLNLSKMWEPYEN